MIQFKPYATSCEPNFMEVIDHRIGAGAVFWIHDEIFALKKIR